MGRSGPGFSLMEQRKKRASHSSQRNARRKITVFKTDSTIPFVFDLWVSRLRQFGQRMYIFGLSLIPIAEIPAKYKAPSSSGLRVPLAAIVSQLGMAVRVQPGQQATNATVR